MAPCIMLEYDRAISGAFYSVSFGENPYTIT